MGYITVKLTDDQAQGLQTLLENRIRIHTVAMNRPPRDIELEKKIAKKIAFYKRLRTALVKAKS